MTPPHPIITLFRTKISVMLSQIPCNPVPLSKATCDIIYGRPLSTLIIYKSVCLKRNF